jgi:hypothetical protein
MYAVPPVIETEIFACMPDALRVREKPRRQIARRARLLSRRAIS